MILSTAMVYIRLFVIILVFQCCSCQTYRCYADQSLLVSLLISLLLYGRSTKKSKVEEEKVIVTQKNPLELAAALIFATLFVLISLASAWAKKNFGDTGLYTLATLVGVTDISPFVVSLAQDSVYGLNAKVVSASSDCNIFEQSLESCLCRYICRVAKKRYPRFYTHFSSDYWMHSTLMGSLEII